jgi:hypothetical protein
MIEIQQPLKREELNKSETPVELETHLAFVYLITGATILGKVARVVKPNVRDPLSEGHGEAWLVKKGLEIQPIRDPSGRIVSAAMIPYGSIGGIVPPMDNVIFEDFHVMHVQPSVPQNFADDYIRATSGIQIAR